MKRKLILSLAVSLVSIAGWSQNIDKAKVDAYFDTLAGNNKFMGSVAISHNGETIYAKTVGFADIEHDFEADENSKYRIASVSKTFTTVLILKAIEENKLHLNQTVSQFFPTIENSDRITIEQILYHRSGLPDILWNDGPDWVQPRTEPEMIGMISNGGSDFEPDSQTNYINTGFFLLSYVLEKIYEKPYSEILEEKIVNPIGLKNTYLGENIDVNNNECNPYSHYGWIKQPMIDRTALLGAAGVVSNAIDLTVFSDALFSGKLISMASLQKMKTLKDDYGMGLFEMSFSNRTCFWIEGGLRGFRSWLAYFPDSNISIAFAANGVNINFYDVIATVLKAVFNEPFEIPEFQNYHVADEELDKYAGVYSSEQLPVKMFITKVNNTLYRQLSGGDAIPMQAIAKDKFEISEYGAILEFSPSDKTVVFYQRGNRYNFTRDE
ncbi:serine hydrolase domain-containing protein [uncultured Alistipes sp.]|jgi:beta-lactamase|uniref:serine hydrolase domain-containing protein n=1 Tax=uncultured Alistipes sp. TaxID=538949 RepID=UPI0025F9F843|nr:serine hydrolase domain-containing protein [uncultured Alistipes sp.]